MADSTPQSKEDPDEGSRRQLPPSTWHRRSRPGALPHVEFARLARFERPGHAVTGIRDETGAEKRASPGYVYLHCVIDDRSRYAYVEQHRDQGGGTAAAVLGRAIEHFHLASLGKMERFIQTLKREWIFAHS